MAVVPALPHAGSGGGVTVESVVIEVGSGQLDDVAAAAAAAEAA